jgi:hypothetical protein
MDMEIDEAWNNMSIIVGQLFVGLNRWGILAMATPDNLLLIDQHHAGINQSLGVQHRSVDLQVTLARKLAVFAHGWLFSPPTNLS